MAQKTFNRNQSNVDPKVRRADSHARKQKVNKAKDHDWKQESSMLHLMGYGKYA